MLAHQRLGQVQGFDEFMNAVLALPQLQHNRDAHRRGQCAQDLPGVVQVIAVEVGGAIGNHFH